MPVREDEVRQLPLDYVTECASESRGHQRSMKPAPFQYHAPTALDEAAQMLHELEDAKLVAGGQSLLPMLNLRLARFEHLVDLRLVPGLSTIERDDGTIHVGAMVRQATIERDDDVATSAPLLARATKHIGHFQIRNRGTLGGSVAHADPAAEYPAVMLALDATLHAHSTEGSRAIAAHDFFTGTWTTSLTPDEILVGAALPAAQPRSGFAIDEVARRHGDFAIVGAACAVRLSDGDEVLRCAIALFGIGSMATRAPAAEAALVGAGAGATDDEVVAVTALAASDLDPFSDVHAPASYRKRVAAVVVKRALTRALEEARRG